MDLDDGMIERIVLILNSDNSSFETTFSHTTRISLTENHLWLSLVLRQPHSAFSRVQRVSCLMTLLLLTMISNAMFFLTTSENVVTPDTVKIGRLSFSLRAFYISIVGAVITVPPILLLAFLFRNTRRHFRQVMDKDNKSDKKYNKRKMSYDDQEDFSETEYVDTKMHDNRNLRKRQTNKGEIVYHEYAKFGPWMRKLTWMILLTVCAVSSFFLILYSMEWGQSKSEEWLTTFLMSFVESIIIVDPTKVSTCSLEISYQAFVSKSVNLCNKNVDIKLSVHDVFLK
jgi:polycystin 1L2